MRLTLLILLLIQVGLLKAQVTIWSESFDQYTDGDTVAGNFNQDNPEIDWTMGGCVVCPDSVGDWWEIRGQRLEAHDVNQVVFFQSELIDISAFQQVSFQMDIVEIGDLEGPYFGSDDCIDQANQDFVDASYRLDNGPWQLVPNYLSWCGLYANCNHTLYGDDEVSGDCRSTDLDWDSVNVVIGGLNGSTLQFRIELINSADDEFISIDNLEVKGQLVLPVELVKLRATPWRQQVEITWSTLSETNSHRFFLYGTATPQTGSWRLIDSVDAAGQSDTPLDYVILDTDPNAGSNFYRLQQVDFDGFTQWSKVIKIQGPKSSAKLYPTFPNKEVFIEGFDQDQIQRLMLTDQWGRRYSIRAQPAGLKRWSISLLGMPKGVYWINSLHGSFDPLRVVWRP